MKKRSLLFTAILAAVLLFSPCLSAQEEEQARPAYITVSTWHWNMDYEDFDMDTWKAVEKEFFDNVTAKNELVMGSGVYLHHFTPDNTELLLVSAYGSWEDIDKAGDRGAELAKEAWPDEAAREAFFKKRMAYYSNMHSDEIYAPLANAIPANIADAKILYVRRSHLAFPEDGSYDEFMDMHKEYVDNVFAKNDLIKGYYPQGHAWGSDRTEFVEAYFFDSVSDLENSFDKNGELYEAHWPDEAERKARQKKASKYFTGKHGDYIYDVVSELVK